MRECDRLCGDKLHSKFHVNQMLLIEQIKSIAA